MKYKECKKCCFYKNGRCKLSGPTVDLLFYVKRHKDNKKKCKKFKLKIGG